MKSSVIRYAMPLFLACALVPVQVSNGQGEKEAPNATGKDAKAPQAAQGEAAAAAVADKKPPREKWEYKHYTSYARRFPQRELNALGAEGWELVHFHLERENGYYTLYVFKRRAQ